MTAALALESLMLHPDYDRFIAQVRQATPVALVDQLDAATTHATVVATTVAGRAGGYDIGAATAGDLPGWLRLGLLDALTQWADGKASTCRHSPDPDRPEPVLAAAWKPGLITCVRCAHLWSLGREANLTCDCCGRVCPTDGDGVYPGVTQFGSLLFQYGTCVDCRPSIASATGPLRVTLPAEQDDARGTGRVRPRGQRGRRRGKGGR